MYLYIHANACFIESPYISPILSIESTPGTPSSGGSSRMSGVLLRHPDSLLLSGGGAEAYINFRDGSSLNMKSATLGRRHVSTQVCMFVMSHLTD